MQAARFDAAINFSRVGVDHRRRRFRRDESGDLFATGAKGESEAGAAPPDDSLAPGFGCDSHGSSHFNRRMVEWREALRSRDAHLPR
jgi:hypothetical protein